MAESGQYSSINHEIYASLQNAADTYKILKKQLPILRKQSDGNYDLETLKKYFEILPKYRIAQISVIIFSCTFCESLINFYFSIKLNHDQLKSIENTKLLEKWTEIPTIINTDYNLNKSKSIYSDLKELIKYRNSIIHPKPIIVENEQIKHRGNIPELSKLTEKKIYNFSTLPFRLLKNLIQFETSDISFLLAITSGYNIKKLLPHVT